MGATLAIVGLLATAGIWGYTSYAESYDGVPFSPPRGYQAQIFQVTDCPQSPVGDRFLGVEYLVNLMGSQGLKLHDSATESMTSGPGGIIAADDVVVIKINYQWDERGGTNVDVLSGVIRSLIDHPDGFTGEIVVCENSQFNSIDGFDRSYNNAQTQSRSPHDVVVSFQGLGFTVSHFDWTVTRYTSVNEFSDGDYSDGYVVYSYDSGLAGRISYPKFTSDDGTYISLRDGIWNGSTYDRDSLKFINIPVLKSHSATYGATACVKHYMGVVTRELSTSSHYSIGNGLMGATMGEIQAADLNILDCIWINANPHDGPWTSYGGRNPEGHPAGLHRPGGHRHLGGEEHPHPGVHRQWLLPALALSQCRSRQPEQRVPRVSGQLPELHAQRRDRGHQRPGDDRLLHLERDIGH